MHLQLLRRFSFSVNRWKNNTHYPYINNNNQSLWHVSKFPQRVCQTYQNRHERLFRELEKLVGQLCLNQIQKLSTTKRRDPRGGKESQHFICFYLGWQDRNKWLLENHRFTATRYLTKNSPWTSMNAANSSGHLCRLCCRLCRNSQEASYSDAWTTLPVFFEE